MPGACAAARRESERARARAATSRLYFPCFPLAIIYGSRGRCARRGASGTILLRF